MQRLTMPILTTLLAGLLGLSTAEAAWVKGPDGILIREQSKADRGTDGKVKGKLLNEDGQPMANCKVCFFDEEEGPIPGEDSRWWRIPDREFNGLVDAEGGFDAEVPPGAYTLASVKRLSANENFGPPLDGEQVFLSQRVTVTSNERVNIGTGKAKRHQNPGGESGGQMTKIEGTIVDQGGMPFKGAFVVAYPYGYLSKRTKSDGRFVLYVPEGGEYSLIARTVYGFT